MRPWVMHTTSTTRPHDTHNSSPAYPQATRPKPLRRNKIGWVSAKLWVNKTARPSIQAKDGPDAKPTRSRRMEDDA